MPQSKYLLDFISLDLPPSFPLRLQVRLRADTAGHCYNGRAGVGATSQIPV